MTKRFFHIFVIFMLIFALSACGSKPVASMPVAEITARPATPEPTATLFPTATPQDGAEEALDSLLDELSAIGVDPAQGQKDITNILLIGTDSRGSDRGRSDSIMILTVDALHGRIKLTSIMRDTYIQFPTLDETGKISGTAKSGSGKINAAYSRGGEGLLAATIEESLGIPIDHYVIVDFWGFKDAINTMGGLELTVTEEQLVPLNNVLAGTLREFPNMEPEIHTVEKAGLQRLDGFQTLAYARMRHLGNGDYDRTARQREVVEKAIQGVRDTPVLQYPELIGQFMKNVQTDMSVTDMVHLAWRAFSMEDKSINQLLLPLEGLRKHATYASTGFVILTDFTQTSRILKDWIYDDVAVESQKQDAAGFQTVADKFTSGLREVTGNADGETPETDNTEEAPKNGIDPVSKIPSVLGFVKPSGILPAVTETPEEIPENAPEGE